jgi:hypothetical protein
MLVVFLLGRNMFGLRPPYLTGLRLPTSTDPPTDRRGEPQLSGRKAQR